MDNQAEKINEESPKNPSAFYKDFKITFTNGQWLDIRIYEAMSDLMKQIFLSDSRSTYIVGYEVFSTDEEPSDYIVLPQKVYINLLNVCHMRRLDDNG
jgi:hypothetical protein